MAEPVPASSLQGMASLVHDVLHAAPMLKVAPGAALTVAKAGGNVTENAQSLAGVAHAHAIEKGVNRVRHDVGPDQELATTGFHTGLTSFATPAATPSLGTELGHVAGAVGQRISHIPGYVMGNVHPQSGTQEAVGALTGQSVNPTGAVGAAATGRAAPGPAPGTATVEANLRPALTQLVSQATNQFNPNQIFQMPSHIYRYLYDIRARHGNGAMLEAAIPIIASALGAYALTRSSSTSEEADAAIMAAETQATQGQGANQAAKTLSDMAANLTPSSARAGYAARRITTGILSPGVAALRVPGRAINAVSTSPVALGGEGAAMVSSQIIHPDSWQRTANATTWKLPDGRVGPTFGQTVAGAVGLHPGAALYNGISGALDAMMFLAVPDPLGAAGRVYSKAHGEEGVGGFLGQRWGGTSPVTADGVESAYTQYPKVRAGMDAIAGKTAGEIATDPTLAPYAPLFPHGARAMSALDVKQVFKDAAQTQELMTTSALPQIGAYGKARSRGSEAPTATSPSSPPPTTPNCKSSSAARSPTAPPSSPR